MAADDKLNINDNETIHMVYKGWLSSGVLASSPGSLGWGEKRACMHMCQNLCILSIWSYTTSQTQKSPKHSNSILPSASDGV